MAIKDRLEELREQRPALDHVLRTVQHYGAAQGSQQAGGVTYFGFLSFFPIMALAFFVIGYVAKIYPDAQDTLIEAIQSVLPGLIGTGDNEISLDDVQSAAGAVGLIGLVGVLFAGLGWLSAMREALIAVFELPAKLKPNFVIGKGRDLITLALIGLVLVLSVGVSGVVTRFSGDLLDFLNLDAAFGWLLAVLALAIGIAANVALFYAMFRLLADPPTTPTRSLLSGALLGAIGFEVLKQLSSLLIASTKGQPAFQAFGIALVLLVWINYFSRVTLYAAAWAHTSPEARAARPDEGPQPVQGPRMPRGRERVAHAVATSGVEPATGTARKWVPFAGGAAAMLGLVALIRKRDS